MEKLLTIIIPCYNSSEYIDKCISSLIVEEIIDKLEVIVVNDGSTDGCEMICSTYVEKYPNTVMLLNKENGGHGSAINEGVKFANGKYMKVLDADDWLKKDNLELFIKKLEKIDADVVLTHHHTVDVCTGQVKGWTSFPPKFEVGYTLEYIVNNWKLFDRSMTFHGITYNTTFYKEHCIKLSENIFYEDHEYATFPCCYARSVVPIDIYIYEYRIGDVSQSVSHSNQLNRITHTETVIKRLILEKKTVKTERVNVHYIEKKTHLLILSYLVTSLLCDDNKCRGRERAKAVMDLVKNQDYRIYEMTKTHYRILKTLNILHVSVNQYQWVLSSRVYNIVRKNHKFVS